ncbi:MAG: tRNA (adenosine(37)-N6)-threonylcarbamoyltransferase complex ATPase subunit type 1 TsaE [Candidatus Saccharicenans sp.]|nr:tRNA (adenosine(37)-N6)-threonylcarbamoyltransferase complex ATPase subunit type 1 TsaE [Candidatus Saccharicenans sp.]
MPGKKSEIEIKSFSEEETFGLGEKIARELRGDELILITGELGAGKTVLVKGLASGLGVIDVDSVCSPSFTLVNIYPGRVNLIHVDLYRLEHPEEIADLGLEDYLGAGVMAVEWAERLPEDFRTDRTLEVLIGVESAESRLIKIKSCGIYLELDNQ